MIAFVVEGIYYAKFFTRIVNSISKNSGVDFVFYCRDESTVSLIKYAAPFCHAETLPVLSMLPKYDDFCAANPSLAVKMDSALKSSFEYLIGGVSYEQCWSLLLSYLLYFNEKIDRKTIDKVIMCSGCGIAAKAVGIVCDIKCISKQYVELSNLPNKIFIDPVGTNAHSKLALNPCLLDHYPSVKEAKHQEWLRVYKKIKSMPPPQSVGNILSEQISALSKDKILKNTSDYIFVPLQVSNDAQLWMHSDYKNVDLITHALSLVDNDGSQIVVKIHPAEMAVNELVLISELRDKYAFKISMEPTTRLIEQAGAIVTINSTVGLEAMLYQKPLSILGRTYYKDFNTERLKKYIHHYLFDGVEFFSNEKIDSKKAISFIHYT